MSFKNKLQEYCQQRNLHLPTYTTSRVDGSPDHAPLWDAIVYYDNGFVFGEPSGNKTGAENNAAKVALSTLKQSDTREKIDEKIPQNNDITDVIKYVQDADRIILVDIENIPQALNLNRNTTTKIIGVVGHCHSKAHETFPFCKYIVHSSLSDAADHALTFLAGHITAICTKNPTIIVLSRDHYAEITVKCLNAIGYNGVHITSVQEMEKYL